MTENLKIAYISGGCVLASSIINVAAVVVSRLMSRGEHRETQQTIEHVKEIVSKNGSEKHP